MPPAPAGKIYEVWVERRSTAMPTDALFDANAAGGATVAVPGNLHGAQAVLVTAERSGGARVPTMTPLIDAPLG
ncbi:MAG: anti-sigma factor [Solirubrobacteraceae bacterium]